MQAQWNHGAKSELSNGSKIAIDEKCLCHNLKAKEGMAALVSRQHVYTIKTKTSHLENWIAFFVRQQAALTTLVFSCYQGSFMEVPDETLKLSNEGQKTGNVFS